MTIAPTRPRVAIFATCFNDTMFPKAPIATVKLLRRLGVDVEFPTEQTCCGQMFTNTGYANDAKGLVRGFVDTFDAFDYVVAPSGSCTGSVREQHEMIAERDSFNLPGCEHERIVQPQTLFNWISLPNPDGGLDAAVRTLIQTVRDFLR